MMVVAAAATHASSQQQRALPLLALNAEMQKYNQQQLQLHQHQHQHQYQNNNANGRGGGGGSGVGVTRTSIPTMVLETPPSSTPPSTAYEDRAMNTELSGDDFREQLLRRTADGHIICSRCLDASKEHYYCCPPRSACEQLGSPQPEGSLSFANIKLDCMCSQSEDLDQTQRRRPALRSAATNTPPTSCKRGPRNLLEAEVSISYQICDNCRSKYKLNGRRRSGEESTHPATSLPSQIRSSELLDRSASSTAVGKITAHSTDDLALFSAIGSSTTVERQLEPARDPDDPDQQPGATPIPTSTPVPAPAPSLGNVSNASNNSTSQTDKTNGSGGTTRPKRPDKLVLDLNDRSKYTKEVSV